MKRYPDEFAEKVGVYYKSHPSAVKVAKRFGIPTSSVYRILARLGIERVGDRVRNARQRKLPPSPELRDLYLSGKSMGEIAVMFGVTTSTVKESLERSGVSRRRRGGQRKELTTEHEAEIVRLYSEMGSQTAVAATVERSQAVISRVLRRNGVTDGRRAQGERHGSWKGGRSMVHGYVQVLVDPSDPVAAMRNSLGYVLEHRLVMARALGRPLSEHETVHHVNGDKKDNRLSNLQLRFGRHGKGVAMVCAKCGSHEIAYKELD